MLVNNDLTPLIIKRIWKVSRDIGTSFKVHFFVDRNLSTALSSCIYECLCDSDSIVVGKEDDDVGLEGFTK